MNDAEFLKYVDLLMSMSVDYKMGGITRETYESNLRMIIEAMIPPTHPEDQNDR